MAQKQFYTYQKTYIANLKLDTKMAHLKRTTKTLPSHGQQKISCCMALVSWKTARITEDGLKLLLICSGGSSQVRFVFWLRCWFNKWCGAISHGLQHTGAKRFVEWYVLVLSLWLVGLDDTREPKRLSWLYCTHLQRVWVCGATKARRPSMSIHLVAAYMICWVVCVL